MTGDVKSLSGRTVLSGSPRVVYPVGCVMWMSAWRFQGYWASLMRIGIIGSGIAGLSAAWIFQQAGTQVTLFERSERLGMDAHSANVELGDRAFRIDVPPRMFNSSLWPNLTNLYDRIGIEKEPVSPTKSFCTVGQASVLNLKASYQPKLSPSLILNSTTRSILQDIGRMLAEAKRTEPDSYTISMREYLQQHNYCDAFIFEFLYPALSSTVCTCSYASLDAYPAKTLLPAMFRLTQPEGLFRVRHGVSDVVQRLSQSTKEILLRTTVVSVEQTDAGVTVRTDDGQSFCFDHVVVATQANAALRLLQRPSDREQQMLSSFRYEPVRVVVHTDESLMPSRRKDWTTFNVISNGEKNAAMCTIWMNRFQRDLDGHQALFQTILPIAEPQAQKVICDVRMERPVVDQASLEGLRLMTQLHDEPNRKIWFAGSYANAGVPLLESGVASSLNVAKRLRLGSDLSKPVAAVKN